jgi:hypothetical protein
LANPTTNRPAGLETVIVVHGTFAAGATWWRQDGSFCARLDRELQSRGSPARCWAHVASDAGEFVWTGRNSDLEREAAARDLARYINDIVATQPISRCHFICHSHGGNVFMLMREFLDVDTFEAVLNGSKVFLGTPFYEYIRHTLDENTSTPKEFGLFISLTIFCTFYLMGLSGIILILLGLALAVPVIRFMILPFHLPVGQSGFPWHRRMFEGRNAIFSCKADEALRALQTAASYWKHPIIEALKSAPRKWKGMLIGKRPRLYFDIFTLVSG